MIPPSTHGNRQLVCPNVRSGFLATSLPRHSIVAKRFTRVNDLRRDRAEARFRSVLADRIVNRVLTAVFPGAEIDRIDEEIAERRIDPYTAADGVVLRMEVR